MISNDEFNYLLLAEAIKERSERMLQCCLGGETEFFIEWKAFNPLIDFVIEVTKHHYPNGEIPLHSRWQHYYFGGRDCAAQIHNSSNFTNLNEQIKAQIDLIFVSLLMDAGAGPDWRYHDNESNQDFLRSEGLAIATLRMFLAGFFSNSMDKHPWRVDAEALIQLSPSALAKALQVSDDNPLLGTSNRIQILKNLGTVLSTQFKDFETNRPSELVNFIQKQHGNSLTAAELLHLLLVLFNDIWPKRNIELKGDVWWYPHWGSKEDFTAILPFHKLSIWLTLSLIEPLELAGIHITDLESLPGLAEYRNGGLLIDSGLLNLKNNDLLNIPYSIDDPIIIEWRALTIALIQQIAVAVRYKLKKTAAQLPIAKVLQGGTWFAGRQLAYQRRPDAGPPLKINSDGTVF